MTYSSPSTEVKSLLLSPLPGRSIQPATATRERKPIEASLTGPPISTGYATEGLRCSADLQVANRGTSTIATPPLATLVTSSQVVGSGLVSLCLPPYFKSR